MQEVADYMQLANSDRELIEKIRDRERFLIDQRLDRADWYEEGVEDGREEGKKNNIKEIVKNMISNGITKEDIIKLTGISEQDFAEANQ